MTIAAQIFEHVKAWRLYRGRAGWSPFTRVLREVQWQQVDAAPEQDNQADGAK